MLSVLALAHFRLVWGPSCCPCCMSSQERMEPFQRPTDLRRNDLLNTKDMDFWIIQSKHFIWKNTSPILDSMHFPVAKQAFPSCHMMACSATHACPVKEWIKAVVVSLPAVFHSTGDQASTKIRDPILMQHEGTLEFYCTYSCDSGNQHSGAGWNFPLSW